jgi:hypothetical protein
LGKDKGVQCKNIGFPGICICFCEEKAVELVCSLCTTRQGRSIMDRRQSNAGWVIWLIGAHRGWAEEGEGWSAKPFLESMRCGEAQGQLAMARSHGDA